MRVSENLVINTHGSSKSFGDLRVLSSFDLKVQKNSIFGFLGPNGDDYYSYTCKHDGTNKRLCSRLRLFSPIRRLARVKTRLNKKRM